VIAVKSGMQRIVALSVTEAEVIAMVQAIQELLYANKKVLEAMELKIELPMIVKVDNKRGGFSKRLELQWWHQAYGCENDVC
jgi:hypothetical protein